MSPDLWHISRLLSVGSGIEGISAIYVRIMRACSGFWIRKINISKLTIHQNKRFSQFIRPINFQGQPPCDFDSRMLLAKVALTTSCDLSCFSLMTFLWISFPFKKQKLWSSHFWPILTTTTMLPTWRSSFHSSRWQNKTFTWRLITIYSLTMPIHLLPILRNFQSN